MSIDRDRSAIRKDDISVEALAALSIGESLRLSDLQTSPCPKSVGVYTLWDGDHFLYVGIAKVDPTQTSNPQAQGIRGRLNTYRKARLTSEFTVSTFLRFVVPHLDSAQIACLATGSLTLRDMTVLVQEHIRENICYRTWSCSVEQAVALENHIRAFGLPKFGLPLFNPSPAPSSKTRPSAESNFLADGSRSSWERGPTQQG